LSTSWEKQARKLLLNPYGREALEAALGIKLEMVKDEKELQENKPIVAILCPTYRAPEPRMQDALGKMVAYTRDKDFAVVYSGAPCSASIVHWSRNWLVSEQIKSGKPWTHVLFIDDDIIVEPDALERLLSHKKDIVAGLCTRRNDPPVPNIRAFDTKAGSARQIWEWPEGKLIDGIYAGTGLMLISKHALEQVAQAYFDCLWEKDFYGLDGEQLEKLKEVRLRKFDSEKACYWFRFLPTSAGIEMGEDMAFCHMAKEYCGLEIYVDTAVQPGHLGGYPFSIKDFTPYRDDCILRAKINGEYPMEIPPMKISILCPTRGRPEQVKNMLRSLRDTSTEIPEVVFYVDEDDTTFPEALWHEYENHKVLRGPRIVLSQMWNKCAEAATGEIFLLCGDDVLFKSPAWDHKVRTAFAAFPDRLVLVHGDDGIHGNRFGTHCFLHRAWMDAVGYFCPPYFSSDYNDTWFNDVFNALNRRVYLPIITEHLHPIAGKGKWDKTHKERLERGKQDNVDRLYKELAAERFADIQKVSKRIGIPWEQPVTA
jgi:hypothetical protein